ncbi:biotin transporter BioY [Inquilinus sp. Marseille-Q2685]|uniref:biotin transporter BioY n=1 Tax=Inquilinus sp. Marseille-Q2685 TaxID=2866581 RepID=UPI001CE43400|nr:biotin transporter BioY [Inquilinus sp. Marseille-Q2685]
MTTRTLPPMLSLWRADGQLGLLRSAVLVVLGTALMTLSAKIQVPFFPVPMTMQTAVVLLIGGAYGWRLGGLTMLAYLAEGFVGLPVFAGLAAGPAYFAGPTAGYLVGFVASAALMGLAVERGWTRSLAGMAAAITVASLVPFVTGVAWLAVLVGPAAAGTAGLVPFIPAAILKGALAGLLLARIDGLARRRDA